jgi:hypothetical protein
VLFANTTQAADGGLSLGGRVGTQGLGLEISKSVSSRFNLRCGLNVFNGGSAIDANLARGSVAAAVRFDGRVRLKTAGLLADVYTSPRFHVSGGLIYNRSTVEIDARPQAPITVNDQTYSVDEIGTLNGDATIGGRWVPYAGIGFGNAVTRSRRVTFLADLGVVFQGRPRLTLTASRATTEELRRDVNAAAEQVNNDHLDKSYLRYYPVLSLGIGVRLF